MPLLSRGFGSVSGGLALVSDSSFIADYSQNVANTPFLLFPSNKHQHRPFSLKLSVSSSTGSNTSSITTDDQSLLTDYSNNDDNNVKLGRRSADWKQAKEYKEKGLIYEAKVEGYNGGGLLIKFNSLLGFLPFPQLSPLYSCKEPHKTIQEIAKALTGSTISVKVIHADEVTKRLIFSEKEANWSKYSPKLKVGDVFEARVGSVEDYGAFIHLRFSDGCYYLTGLVHVSEVSWDLVQDTRDVLAEGDKVRVKIVNIDREKSRITLSMKQLEEDPLLETLDKVIPQDGSSDPDALNGSDHFTIEPLQGLDNIIEELLKEDGIDNVKISRQGFEKRVVSQDLQLWLSNAPPNGDQYTLLARAGRQVQEIQLTTSLDQEGIKRALQQVLERVP